MAKGLSFSVYGENVIILGQNGVILMLIWSYNKSISCFEKLLVIAFFITYAYVLFSGAVMSEVYWLYVSNSSSLM